MRYLAAGAQHIGARRYQQDAICFAQCDNPEFFEHAGFLSILCDGMGGMEHGDIASETAIRTLAEAYQRKLPGESIRNALVRAAWEANDRVFSTAKALGMPQGIGTTLVAAVLHGQSLYYVSVGDSALFLISDGRLQMLNQPHVFANQLARAVSDGMLSAEDAARHPDREALTSFIGIERLAELDISENPIPVAQNDVILLASDGLFKSLDEWEILDCLTGEPAKWAQDLVDRTMDKQRTGQDNVSAVVVWAADRDLCKVVARPTTKQSKALWLVALVLVVLASLSYWAMRRT